MKCFHEIFSIDISEIKKAPHGASRRGFLLSAVPAAGPDKALVPIPAACAGHFSIDCCG